MELIAKRHAGSVRCLMALAVFAVAVITAPSVAHSPPTTCWVVSKPSLGCTACRVSVPTRADNRSESEFTATKLGSADPTPVVDEELDIDLLAAGPLVGRARYRDSLHRAELVEFLDACIASDDVKRTMWKCAIKLWPTLIEALNGRRIEWRDAMIGSSSELAERPENDATTDERLMVRHAALVIRIQSERSALE